MKAFIFLDSDKETSSFTQERGEPDQNRSSTDQWLQATSNNRQTQQALVTTEQTRAQLGK